MVMSAMKMDLPYVNLQMYSVFDRATTDGDVNGQNGTSAKAQDNDSDEDRDEENVVDIGAPGGIIKSETWEFE